MSNDSPEIEHTETETSGEFTIGREAIMTYRKEGDDHIVVNHTAKAKVRVWRARSTAQ